MDRIFFIFASDFLGSPGLLGKKIFFPPIRLAKYLICIGFPLPKLKISPTEFVFAALKKASTTSVTNTKSLVCLPFPTIVKGFLLNFCLKKTPKTAPYAPVVLTLGP